jgi:hypothetical protein|tara:strand:- start:177 stop:620 length:444 start_codon:yes stop_codon:yes gene_type:complete
MTLDEIHEMWKRDSQLDEMNLDNASRDAAKLHSKYLELHSHAKLHVKKLELDFKVLLRDKWLWYNGKMPKEKIDELGWKYDALDGLKILKGEMDYYYDADQHIQEAQAKIELYKTQVETFKEILENIKWRHQTIKNMIEWRKFTSGV